MNLNKKGWIVLAFFVLALAILACGSSSPTATPKPPASAVGRWEDPDSNAPYTITTIEEQNGQNVVVSITNSGRGDVNELTYSKYVNGVLTWEYCAAGIECITSEFVSVTSNSLTATWRWTDGGNGGTTVYKRVP